MALPPPSSPPQLRQHYTAIRAVIEEQLPTLCVAYTRLANCTNKLNGHLVSLHQDINDPQAGSRHSNKLMMKTVHMMMNDRDKLACAYQKLFEKLYLMRERLCDGADLGYPEVDTETKGEVE